MKTTLIGSAVAVLLVVLAPGRCFGMMEIEVVTKERAKALGMEVKVTAAGPELVRVALAFKTDGELKAFNRVDLEIRDGEKLIMSSALKEEKAGEGQVAVSFAADRGRLDKITLRVVVIPAPRDIRGYEIRVKDFVEVGKVK
jgi:hypothetical protein